MEASCSDFAVPAMRRAKPSIVGVSKIERSGNSVFISRLIREITCVASSEWPPKAKKLSDTPTRSMRSTSDQMSASCCSVSVRGAM